MIKKAILITCMLTAAALASAQTSTATTKKTINWVIPAEPPITYVENGEFLGYGIEMLKMLQEKLPAYDHKFSAVSNYKRLTEEVKNGPLTVAVGLFKTEERLKIMWFSDVPFFYFYDIQAALSKKDFEALGQPQKISIRELLKNQAYTLGISDGRTYFDKLGKILGELGNQKNIYKAAHSTVAENLFQMLVGKRINYMFLYPEEAMYLSTKFKVRDQIVTVPIQEAVEFGYSWLVCTKNAEGKVLVNEINKALVEVRKQDKFSGYYTNWISSNLHKDYKTSYRDSFLKIYEKSVDR